MKRLIIATFILLPLAAGLTIPAFLGGWSFLPALVAGTIGSGLLAWAITEGSLRPIPGGAVPTPAEWRDQVRQFLIGATFVALTGAGVYAIIMMVA